MVSYSKLRAIGMNIAIFWLGLSVASSAVVVALYAYGEGVGTKIVATAIAIILLYLAWTIMSTLPTDVPDGGVDE